MVIRPANYQHMSWLGAIGSRPKDQSSDVAQRSESEVKDALQETAALAFGLPQRTEDKSDAITRAAHDIAEQGERSRTTAAVNSIKSKLAAAEIDPVALGVGFRMPNGQVQKVTKEDWDRINDPMLAERIATMAAVEQEKQMKQAWQKDAVKPAQGLCSIFDAQMSRSGKIMSAAAANEDIAATAGIVPANSTGILHPDRMDEFAKTETPHDKSVAAIRSSQKAREADKKAQLAELAAEAAKQPDAMKQGQVLHSGGLDSSVFAHRIPSNQVSIADTAGTGTMTQLQIKESLSKLFTTRVPDNGQSIREANKAHKEEIQGKEQKDRSWEQVQKPLSTSELSKRLADALWPCSQNLQKPEVK
jgi:hypothetical protein